MNENLPIKKQNSKVALSKTKNLMGIADKILLTTDDNWIEKLWKWADENSVPELEWIENQSFKGHGRLKGLPRDKKKLISLNDLYLNSTRSTLSIKLPVEVCNLTNLVKLYLSQNKLKELPKEIGNLTNLSNLTLSFNQLTILPEEICKLTKLNRLVLVSNRLTELPKKITTITSLTSLCLQDNPNLILTQKQKEWMLTLEKNGCSVEMDHDLFDRNLKTKRQN